MSHRLVRAADELHFSGEYINSCIEHMEKVGPKRLEWIGDLIRDDYFGHMTAEWEVGEVICDPVVQQTVVVYRYFRYFPRDHEIEPRIAKELIGIKGFFSEHRAKGWALMHKTHNPEPLAIADLRNGEMYFVERRYIAKDSIKTTIEEEVGENERQEHAHWS